MCYLSSALQMLPSSAWSYLCILYSKCSSPHITKHAYCVRWFWFVVNKCPGYAHADHLVWCSCILYKWSQFIRYYFVLSLRGPLIKEGPLGGCAVCLSGVGQGVGRGRGQWGQASCWQGCVLCADVSLPAGLEQADKMLFFSQCTP